MLNYLSRYLLARRLLPALSEAPSGRVVFVANAGVYGDSLDFADLELRGGKRGLYVAGRTQFANDLLAIELSERLAGTRVEVTCVFPGRVRTSVFRNARGLPWFAHALVPLLGLGALSPSAAAETPVFLAQSRDAIGSGGRFYYLKPLGEGRFVASGIGANLSSRVFGNEFRGGRRCRAPRLRRPNGLANNATRYRAGLEKICANLKSNF